MMPFAPRSALSSAKMQTKLSAWTPLNHQLSNHNVFVERRNLLAKWFDKWSDSQRKAVLQDLVSSCSAEQLRFLSLSVSKRLPLQAADFTCLLPRVLCLYIFSFLDPRSLCRCAQVSWHWKSIVELDQLWMPKCLRLGWCISFSPTPFEQGVWKRHYIHTVQELRIGKPQVRRPDTTLHQICATISSFMIEMHLSGSAAGRGSGTVKQTAALPPWRDSDRHPKDTLRFNYLANLDPIEQALQRNARPDNVRTKPLSEANYKLRKAKSLVKHATFISTITRLWL
uniref:F-box protein 16 n=1 Tax=Myripristis murdjan TaxID=586833 RepID=A0A667Y3W6_9TELE